MNMTALITGASRGIGWELARCFAADEHDLVLVDLNRGDASQAAHSLQSQFGVEALYLVYDLGDPSAPGKIFSDLDRCNIDVEILVNNAGVGLNDSFAEQDPSAVMNLVQVNVSAPTALTRLFLPGMLSRGHGGILNVASLAAFTPGPGMAAYYASKAYVLSLSVAISRELASTDVVVTCLCPGPTETSFAANSGAEETPLFTQFPVMTPEEVAQAGYEGFKSGEAVVIPGWHNRLTEAFTRLVSPVHRALVAHYLNTPVPDDDSRPYAEHRA